MHQFAGAISVAWTRNCFRHWSFQTIRVHIAVYRQQRNRSVVCEGVGLPSEPLHALAHRIGEQLPAGVFDERYPAAVSTFRLLPFVKAAHQATPDIAIVLQPAADQRSKIAGSKRAPKSPT